MVMTICEQLLCTSEVKGNLSAALSSVVTYIVNKELEKAMGLTTHENSFEIIGVLSHILVWQTVWL